MDWNPINENDRRINNIANVLAMTPYDEGGSLKDSVVDLLADLRHFCRVEYIDFDEANQIAERHFQVEVSEEEEFKQKYR
ncbi:MAG: hypothetical protein M0R74_19485 [Dehalococcoidia bacterium]|nr:hypothetical protein [Dehalococcoidia bacterium]